MDASFNAEGERQAAVQRAKDIGAQVMFIETVTQGAAVSRRMMAMNAQDAPWYKVAFTRRSNCCRYEGVSEEQALDDLSKRAARATSSYMPLSSSVYCWARLYDMGAHPEG